MRSRSLRPGPACGSIGRAWAGGHSAEEGLRKQGLEDKLNTTAGERTVKRQDGAGPGPGRESVLSKGVTGPLASVEKGL